MNYVIIGDELFRRTQDGLTLLYIGGLKQMQVVEKVHEGICGAHQAGIVLNGDEVMEFAKEYGIQMLNSSPYYAQANGQAKSSNKTIKVTLSKVIEDNPRDWHELLSEVLWAYRNSKRDSIQGSPYELVYGYVAILPLEVTVKSSRMAKHYDIPIDEYVEAMFMELQDVECKRIDAFDRMMA
ncbi:uncharacterized protein LOC114310732 [Camellia sinensis]|uniref:uncharacterized protein LOC114310732 n=1 Tax=Camellia sinensis TaxID=4442 RepID=UPI00103559BA|nr:uncharacterized protein LOC114310732 [Camellia sinensis]